MENYKVECDVATRSKTSMQITLTEESVHVSAVHREHAVYKAFDELTDRGYTIAGMGEVSMFDVATETWVVIPSHREVSRAVA
jgi:hypothetical protein